MPGECRTCWALCRGRVERGQIRCRQCTEALAVHPNPVVRVALAKEVGTYDVDILELLSIDLDMNVSVVAQTRLAMSFPALPIP